MLIWEKCSALKVPCRALYHVMWELKHVVGHNNKASLLKATTSLSAA